MCNFAGLIVIGFNAIEGASSLSIDAHSLQKNREERRLCHAGTDLHNFFAFVVPLTVEKVSSDQQDSCTEGTQFFSFFIGLYSKAVNGIAKMSVIRISSIK